MNLDKKRKRLTIASGLFTVAFAAFVLTNEPFASTAPFKYDTGTGASPEKLAQQVDTAKAELHAAVDYLIKHGDEDERAMGATLTLTIPYALQRLDGKIVTDLNDGYTCGEIADSYDRSGESKTAGDAKVAIAIADYAEARCPQLKAGITK